MTHRASVTVVRVFSISTGRATYGVAWTHGSGSVFTTPLMVA